MAEAHDRFDKSTGLIWASTARTTDSIQQNPTARYSATQRGTPSEDANLHMPAIRSLAAAARASASALPDERIETHGSFRNASLVAYFLPAPASPAS